VQKEDKRMEMIQTEEKMEFQPVLSSQRPSSESVDLPVPSNEQATKKTLPPVNVNGVS